MGRTLNQRFLFGRVKTCGLPMTSSFDEFSWTWQPLNPHWQAKNWMLEKNVPWKAVREHAKMSGRLPGS
jgi:hypothetical protein